MQHPTPYSYPSHFETRIPYTYPPPQNYRNQFPLIKNFYQSRPEITPPTNYIFQRHQAYFYPPVPNLQNIQRARQFLSPGGGTTAPFKNATNFYSSQNHINWNGINSAHKYIAPHLTPGNILNIKSPDLNNNIIDLGSDDLYTDFEFNVNNKSNKNFEKPEGNGKLQLKLPQGFIYDELNFLHVYLSSIRICRNKKEVVAYGLWFTDNHKMNSGEIFTGGRESIHSGFIAGAEKVIRLIKSQVGYNKIKIFTTSSFLPDNISGWYKNFHGGLYGNAQSWSEVKYGKEISRLCTTLQNSVITLELVSSECYGMKKSKNLAQCALTEKDILENRVV